MCQPGDIVRLKKDTEFTFIRNENFNNEYFGNNDVETIESVTERKFFYEGETGYIYETKGFSHAIRMFEFDNERYQFSILNSHLTAHFDIAKRMLLLENDCYGLF